MLDQNENVFGMYVYQRVVLTSLHSYSCIILYRVSLTDSTCICLYMQSCIHNLLTACSSRQLVEVMSRQFATSCIVAFPPIQMGSLFPFDELLLGPRFSLLGKQHTLCNSPNLHWFGLLHRMTSACGQTCPV